ncbi:MAG: hypothetical protein O3A47_13360, partial [Chloroflexi bacterium]|nr:hypothetical protein [Chloroflexota bacterium]
MDRVPVSPRYFDYLLGVEGCCCVHHCLAMAERYPHDVMPAYVPPQNNFLLHYSGAYNDLPGVGVNLDVTDAGETITVRRTFHTPAGDLHDVRAATRPGSPVNFDHVVEALVKNAGDLEKVRFLLPTPQQAFLGEIPLLRQAIGDRGLLLVRPTQGVDQFLMDSLGIENAFTMYYDDRQLLLDLLQIFQSYHRAILQAVLEQGVGILFETWYNCSPGVGWSPAQFRELFKPLIKQNVELIHSYGAYVDYFDDGRMNDVLEDLAEVGIDVVETLAPPPLGNVDLAQAKRRIGSQVCLKGHTDPVNVICFGTPELIRETVRQAIIAAAPGGGFILGTADSIRPESP